MTIQEILTAAMELEQQIETASTGDPELTNVITRISTLQRELQQTRSVQGALIPDSSRPLTADEQSGKDLEDMLRSLLQAASSKRT